MIGSAVITTLGSVDALEQWRAALNSGEVALWVNNFSPTPDSVLGDFTEASFTGYSRVASPAFSAAYVNPGGKAQIDSALLDWHFTAGAGTATVFGLLIVDSSGLIALAFEKFPAPVVLSPASPDLTRAIQIGAESEYLG